MVTGFTVYDGTIFAPYEGTYCAELSAGLGAGINTIASQAFFMSAGEVLKGAALFDGQDYLPFDDYANAIIYSTSTQTTVWSSNIAAVGDFGHTPWQVWSFTAPDPGIYYIEYSVANYLDNSLPSRAYFDATPTPLPGAFLLLGSGLLGLVGLRRRSTV